MQIAQAPSTSKLRGLVCPACSQLLERRRRHFTDRVLALFSDPSQPLRRYACSDRHCGWEGLLYGHAEQQPGYLPKHRL